MVFFSPKVKEVIETFSGIFGGPDEGEGDVDEEDEPAEEKVYGGSGENKRGSGFIWLSFLKMVSDLTKFNFRECWELPVMEFFSYLTFAIEDERRKAEMMKKSVNKK